MALSEDERKMLEELEAQLSDHDPHFAQNLRQEPDAMQGPGSSVHLSLRNVVLGLLGTVAGIAVLVAGVAFEFVVIAVLGVAIIFGGLWYLSSGIHRSEGVIRAPKMSTFGDFMEKQARAWERRASGE